MLNFWKSEPEIIPLAKLPYTFRERLSYLANYSVVNNLSQVCPDVKKFRFFIPDARDQVYITDNHIVCRWAKKDTIMFRIWRYLYQFEYSRKANDGYHTIKPAWNSVLLVDEIIDKDKKIYVDDTLILHCTIENYEKVIPYIFGPYTRLVLHGNITWNQVQQLLHPGVIQVRINARMDLQPADYDDFVEVATRHVRGKEYNFSFYNKAYYKEVLITRLKTICRHSQNVDVQNNGYDPNTYHVMHSFSSLYQAYYAGYFFIVHSVIALMVLILLIFMSGEATTWQHNETPLMNNTLINICGVFTSVLFFLHTVIFMFGPYFTYPMDIVSDRLLENKASYGCFTVAMSFLFKFTTWVSSRYNKP